MRWAGGWPMSVRAQRSRSNDQAVARRSPRPIGQRETRMIMSRYSNGETILSIALAVGRPYEVVRRLVRRSERGGSGSVDEPRRKWSDAQRLAARDRLQKAKAASARPPHITAREFTDRWYRQNNDAFCRHMSQVHPEGYRLAAATADVASRTANQSRLASINGDHLRSESPCPN